MNILYISSACSEQTLKETSKKYMGGIPLKTPQQTFDLSIAMGLSRNANVSLLSLPPVPSYPKSKCLFFKKKVEKLDDGLNINYIPLINLPLIKSFCILFFILLNIMIWDKKCKSSTKKFILLHWPYYPSMLAAYFAKQITQNKVILIIPDLPAYAATYNESSSFMSKFKVLVIKLMPNLVNKFDGYVLLTKYMRKKLQLLDKPYIIMEGLVRYESIKENFLDEKYSIKVLMYAGAVYKKFGLEKLVKAFKRYANEECELWIYGSGDFVEELKNYERIDKRIKYKGLKFRDEILEIERKATLLINPRPSDEEFTKYSFPSKTLEYMSSGTPLLTTKLPGIPEEYFEHVFLFKDETIEGMVHTFEEVLGKSNEELFEIGQKAKKFVIKEKNYIVQSIKILELFEEITLK